MPASEEIQAIVNEAKEFIKERDLKAAKHKYLDAAEYSLRHIKNEDLSSIDKMSYENLARFLIGKARSIQEEIDAEKLPKPPSGAITKEPKKVDGKPKSIDDGLIIVPSKKSHPYQLFIIKQGGIPIFNYEFKRLSEKQKGSLNDILFSGAITAINSLMMEVIEEPISLINLKDSVLLIKDMAQNSVVLFAKETTEDLENKLTDFCSGVLEAFGDDITSSFAIGQDLSDNPQLLELVANLFPETE